MLNDAFPGGDLISEESRGNMLAEYAALRNEITTFLSLQVQFMNWSVVLGAAIAGLFFKNPSFELVALFPLPFLIFGLLYAEAAARIFRVANYIEIKLRPKLIYPADEPSLEWESFIRKKWELDPVLSMGDKWVRLAIFLVPSLVPIIWLMCNGPQSHHWRLVGSLFTLEFILLFLFLWMWVELQKYGKSLGKKTK
jgi:hypothetical protein